MYVLAWRDGVSGYRFILIGIGVAAFFDGLIGYVLTRAQLFEARQAMHWLTGSVGQASDDELRLLLGALLVLLPLAVLLQRQLRVARTRRRHRPRRWAPAPSSAAPACWPRAVVLVALAVAVAGPIVFVALVAGPIANRLLGPATGGIVAAALVGAALLLTADLVAVHLLPTPLPTGVVTGAVGAPYLLWLLVTTNRQGARRMTPTARRGPDPRLRRPGRSSTDLDVDVLDGKVTAIVGANACGKSTLLRGLARLLQAARRRRATSTARRSPT